MGCNDYYDPAREEEDENWRRNTAYLEERGFSFRSIGSGLNKGDLAECNRCCALVWIGDVWRRSELSEVKAHADWHAEQDNK